MVIDQIKDLMDKKITTQVLPLDSEKITNMTEEELIEYGYITQVMSHTPTVEPTEPEEKPVETPTVEPTKPKVEPVETPTVEPEDTPDEEPTTEPVETPTVEPEEDDSPVVEEEE